MISFLKLIRYKNLLMVLLTMVLTKYALIHSFLSKPYLSNTEFLFLSLSVLLITAGGYIINDIYDVDVDVINKPTKVYVGKTVSKKNAWISYILITSIGVSLGIYISYYKGLSSFSPYFIGIALSLFLYSKYLKRIALIGNLLIASLCAFVIYLIYYFDIRIGINLEQSFNLNSNMTVSDYLSFIIISKRFFLHISFLATFIREVIKDIEDINGDYSENYKTLPILLGRKRTRNLLVIVSMLVFLYMALFVVLFYAFEAYIITAATSTILIILLYFIYILWNAKTKKEFHFLSNLMKVIMLLGILSMILFIFN